MIQAEFENGIEDENNFQIQEINFQNGIDEDDAFKHRVQIIPL